MQRQACPQPPTNPKPLSCIACTLSNLPDHSPFPLLV
uniref:Uncharacterized protein n=1 Tax=Arundo donax TaxID=35708 RepID=A0A0A9EHQ3_ARUDO